MMNVRFVRQKLKTIAVREGERTGMHRCYHAADVPARKIYYAGRARRNRQEHADAHAGSSALCGRT
ncbi:hypothetical protein SBA1_210017 [Candidatus Sulfotelmatobacter kueseliae]|uniref:Uncharacterized protein n=1 Tax=Candidatus Sulfotelmatobacter kueseliae TaxID=2042962 RepID=A0A2U3KGS5_9BACT|nr:hypothetical protein SBA1_210017 [Candidatus Sulfotelmatobacter kueseliae]